MASNLGNRQVVIEPVTGMEARALKDFQLEHKVTLNNSRTGETIEQSMDKRQGTLIGAQISDKPVYINKLRTFVFQKADGTTYKVDDFKALPEQLPAFYPDTYQDPAKRGTRIMECDPTNPDDPFLNNRMWEHTLDEGIGHFNVADPWIGPKVDAMRGNGEYTDAPPGSPTSGSARFRIVNPVDQDAMAEEQVSKITDAMELFVAMKDDKDRMRDMLIVLGFDVDDEEPIGKMQKILLGHVTDEAGYKQVVFRKFATLPPGEMKLRKVVMLGVKQDMIKKRGGIYEYMGEHVGSTLEAVEGYFRDDKNRGQYEGLTSQVL